MSIITIRLTQFNVHNKYQKTDEENLAMNNEIQLHYLPMNFTEAFINNVIFDPSKSSGSTEVMAVCPEREAFPFVLSLLKEGSLVNTSF